MKRLILFTILLTLFGLMGSIFQISENYKHYDIFVTKNRAAYNFQRENIINNDNLDTLREIALSKLESSHESSIAKSELAKSNNASLDVIALMLFGCLVALVVMLIIHIKAKKNEI
ncbi:MAG: hypothetical protein IPI19_16180 [Ignavibacteriales bacterium]|nr:hypothetical protein [Ignavibacteriales bacterium]